MLKHYSKPVLTPEENSSYKKEYTFKLSVLDSCVENETVQIIFSAELNSSVIRTLLEKKEASFGIKITTEIKSYYFEFDINTNPMVVNLKKAELLRIDKIKCRAYVIAEQEIDYLWNNELKDYYEKEYVFHFNKKQVMAESDEEKLDYKSKAESFIKLCKADFQEGKGMFFSVDGANVIQIKVGPQLLENYSKLQSNEKKFVVKDIMNSFMALTSITYALLRIITDGSDKLSNYKEKEWFKALSSSYSDDKYESLEDFINTMIDVIDINEIYRISQKILNNQVEMKIIDTWRNKG